MRFKTLHVTVKHITVLRYHLHKNCSTNVFLNPESDIDGFMKLLLLWVVRGNFVLKYYAILPATLLAFSVLLHVCI